MRLQYNNSHLLFWLLTFAVIIGGVFSKLIQDGMFIDALLYTSVAKNLGNDIGTFWNPYFSESWGIAGRKSFHEQPPLVFGILAQFFKLLGNGMYTERIYTALTTVISAFLIHKIWRIVPHFNEHVKRMSWLPVLIWITFPVVIWTHQNMMCENTMEIFILGSIYFTCSALYSDKKVYYYLVLAACFIFLAALSKGVPGLFPIAAVPFFWLIYRSFSFYKAVLYSLLVIGVVVAIFGVVLIFDEPREALIFYFEKRLMYRVSDQPVVHDRFRVMKELGLHLLLVITAIALFFGVIKNRKKPLVQSDLKAAVFFFIIGITGSVPLMLTLVQRGFYVTPAMPFFAISLAMVLVPTLALYIQRLSAGNAYYKTFLISSIVLLFGAIGFTIFNFGNVSRDQEKITVSRELDQRIDSYATISVSEALRSDWALELYLMRYADISVSPSDTIRGLYLSNNPNDSIGMAIAEQPVSLGDYFFFRGDSK